AVHGRAMHADLFKQPPAHDRHDAAAAIGAVVVGAFPGRANEPPRRARIKRLRRIVLQLFERGADRIAQGFKPGPCALLACGQIGGKGAVAHVETRQMLWWRVPCGLSPPDGPICLIASLMAMAVLTAILSERIPARIGMNRRKSAVPWTSSGTPADSRPNSRI